MLFFERLCSARQLSAPNAVQYAAICNHRDYGPGHSLLQQPARQSGGSSPTAQATCVRDHTVSFGGFPFLFRLPIPVGFLQSVLLLCPMLMLQMLSLQHLLLLQMLPLQAFLLLMLLLQPRCFHAAMSEKY